MEWNFPNFREFLVLGGGGKGEARGQTRGFEKMSLTYVYHLGKPCFILIFPTLALFLLLFTRLPDIYPDTCLGSPLSPVHWFKYFFFTSLYGWFICFRKKLLILTSYDFNRVWKLWEEISQT